MSDSWVVSKLLSLDAKAKVFPSLVDPSMAEAMEAWHVVTLGCDLGISQVHFKGDSLNVVSVLKKEGPCWSTFGHLIEDSKLCLNRLLPFFVHHIKREANKVAHCWAKLAISWLLNEAWVEECSLFIRNVLSKRLLLDQ
jgi:hypothetical protein